MAPGPAEDTRHHAARSRALDQTQRNRGHARRNPNGIQRLGQALQRPPGIARYTVRGMRAAWLKGHLELLLLATLRDGPAHGYAVAEALRSRSDGVFDIGEGTIYPALHRLERAGLLASRWSDDTGRRRRVYRLTAAGRKALAEQTRTWRVFTRAVDAVAAP